MRQEDYPPGTIVFAKLRGYPWWPARVEDDKDIPARILEQRTNKTKGPQWTVYFFGSKDYGFFGPESIRPFDRELVEKELKAKKFKTKELEKAVRQALNPEEADEDEESEEEEEASEEEQEPRKPARSRANRRRGSASDTKKKATSSAGRRSKATANGNEEHSEENEDAQQASKVKRRSRKLDDEEKESEVTHDTNRKRRRKSESVEKEDSPAVNRNAETATEPEASSGKMKAQSEDTKQSLEYKKEYQKLYRLRHALQKLVYNKAPGEIPKKDYPIISKLLRDVEKYPMTANLLRDTKVGKVVKSACAYPYEDDTEHHILERCQQLMNKWKEQFRPQSENGKPVDAAKTQKEATPTSEDTVMKEKENTAVDVKDEPAKEDVVMQEAQEHPAKQEAVKQETVTAMDATNDAIAAESKGTDTTVS